MTYRFKLVTTGIEDDYVSPRVYADASDALMSGLAVADTTTEPGQKTMVYAIPVGEVT